MEHRIGATKRQISNLASNIDPDHVQLVNQTIEIKEKLYHATRKSHGVKIRSGRHEPRSDTNDYERLMKCRMKLKPILENQDVALETIISRKILPVTKSLVKLLSLGG